MHTVSNTPISSALAIAAAAISLASVRSSLNVCRMSLSRPFLRSCTAVDRFDLGVELESHATGLAECRGRGALDAAKRRVDQIACRSPVDLDRAGLDVAGKRVH